MVILHGLLGSLDNWKGFQKRLRERFDIILVDLRNHGLSPKTESCDYEVMAADLDDLFSELQLSPSIVLGHSMGGKVAMQFALQSPTLVQSLIVADMAPKPYDMRHPEMLGFLAELDLDFFADRSSVNAAIESEIPSMAMRQFVLKNLAVTEDGLSWIPNMDSLSKNYRLLNGWEAEGVFEGQTLFVNGGSSDYILKSDREMILKQFPKAQFTEVEGAGHWLHAEKPNEFLKSVEGFLGADRSG